MNHIRIKSGIPKTHHFLYRGNKFPINFDLFKYSSKYFSSNKHELKHSNDIYLIDRGLENTIYIEEKIIKAFIDYVHRKSIELNNENVVQLNFLAQKYEVISLIDETDFYLKRHDDLSFQTLLFNQNDEYFDSSSYEEILSKNLLNYIDDEKLLSLKFPILFRILQKFISNKGSTKIVDFAFKVLDHYKKEASILFHIIDFDDLSEENLNTLLSKTSEEFDFNFINMYLFQFLNKKMEKQEKQNNENIQQIKDNYSHQISELEAQINQLKEEKSCLENENFQLNNQIRNNEERITILKNENEALKIEIEQINQNKSINDKDNDNIEEIIKTQKFVPKEENKLDGIFKYLSNKTDGNIHDNGTIFVSSNSVFHESYCPENLLCDDDDKTYAPKNKDTDVSVIFDFKNMEIEISNYSIKSSSSEKDLSHIKNWTIDISGDGVNWETIDEHSNYEDLNGPNIVKMFNVKPNHFARFARFHHQGEYWGIDQSMMEINSIEFFGRLKTRTS